MNIHNEPFTAKRGDRHIRSEWVVDVVTTDKGFLAERVVYLSVGHNKDRKELYATLSTFDRVHEDTFVVEKFEMFSSNYPRLSVGSEPIGRYSEKALKEFLVRSLDVVRSLDDPRIGDLFAGKVEV
jgi:hypothetical protein